MKMIWFLFGFCLFVFMPSLFYVLFSLPPEQTQGFVQKIFFFHVPSAFAMYLLAVVGMIFSILYLFLKKNFYDQLARANLYIACLFGALVMISGPIWAKPIWGVYWTWDPRLTTSLILFVLLIAYVVVRQLFHESSPQKAARIGAVISIFAVVDIPLVHLSAKLLRGLHPSVLNNPEGLPDSFRTGLEMMVLSFFLLASLLVFISFKLICLNDRAQQLEGEF